MKSFQKMLHETLDEEATPKQRVRSKVDKQRALKLEEFSRLEAIRAGIEASDKGEVVDAREARKELCISSIEQQMVLVEAYLFPRTF